MCIKHLAIATMALQLTAFNANAVEDMYTNSIEMEFVKIPKGCFMMGRDQNVEQGNANELPSHKICIDYNFYLGKYEVTQKEWIAVMGSNPSMFKNSDNPVELVSWNDAQEFIKRLNKKEGSNKYRLPSEAEWEYAARAGSKGKYYFGNSEASLSDYAWYDKNSNKETHTVGQKKPNAWGLYDMLGNVREWVEDCYHDDYSGAPTDGSAWVSSCHQQENNITSYLSKGCAIVNNAYSCRIAFRLLPAPTYVKGYDHGFRVVHTLD